MIFAVVSVKNPTKYLLTSYLSNYFHQALKSNSTLKKGIKLDFKRTDILEESLQILTAKLDLINFPLWINADIIDGPGLNLISNKIVNADTFLSLANQYAPMATVSPGK